MNRKGIAPVIIILIVLVATVGVVSYSGVLPKKAALSPASGSGVCPPPPTPTWYSKILGTTSVKLSPFVCPLSPKVCNVIIIDYCQNVPYDCHYAQVPDLTADPLCPAGDVCRSGSCVKNLCSLTESACHTVTVVWDPILNAYTCTDSVWPDDSWDPRCGANSQGNPSICCSGACAIPPGNASYDCAHPQGFPPPGKF